MHCMIDMETLDTLPTSVILSIGLVKFDPKGMGVVERLELKPDIDEQLQTYKRTTSESTLNWWSTQSPDAIEEAMGNANRISFKDCMDQVYKFCWNQDAIWANGSIFDIVIAEDAFRSLGMNNPWPFWIVRDCRTIYDLAGVSLKDTKYKSKTTHKALEDAEHQALVVQDAYKKFIKVGLKV